MSFFKNKLLRYLLLLLLLLGIIALFKFGCKKDTTPKVAAEKVQFRKIVETVDESGKIYPVNEVKVSADAGSLIEAIYVQEGDTVKTGQLIAVVKTDQTSMVSSGANMQGLQKAVTGGMMNPAALAQAMQQAAQPGTPTLKKQTKITNIYAPMNGVVSGMNVKKGERLMGTEIARIASVNEWEVRAEIGEVDIVKIKEGNAVKLTIEALGEMEITGNVYRIANSNAASGMGNLPSGMMPDITNYKVFIKIKPESLQNLKDTVTGRLYTLRNGMNANIKIETSQKENVLTVPIKAVTTRYKEDSPKDNAPSAGKQKPQTVVFVLKDNIVLKKVVSTGIQDIDYIEIIAGLQNEDKIVTDPFEAVDKILKDGMKVKPVNSKAIFQ